MDAAIAGLIGAFIGALAGIVGAFVTQYLQARTAARNWLRDKRVEAYSNALRYLLRTQNIRSQLQMGREGKLIEQAIQQESEYVTMALLVSAIEALTVPNASWQQDRVTTRFFRFCRSCVRIP
jgi:hypothetical protein